MGELTAVELRDGGRTVRKMGRSINNHTVVSRTKDLAGPVDWRNDIGANIQHCGSSDDDSSEISSPSFSKIKIMVHSSLRD